MSFIQILPEGGLTAIHGSAMTKVGVLHQDDSGNIYRYVKNAAASATLANGNVVCPTTTQWEITVDYSDAVTKKAAGIAISALTVSTFGWILVDGKHSAVWTDAGVAAGDGLVAHSVDGEADSLVTTTENHLVFGFAETADTTTDQHTVAAIIQCL